MSKIVALVPMRHHSQRVPGKNYRVLAGKPLFHHILHTLMQVPAISQICVDTDSLPVIDSIRSSFPAVMIVDRPAHLRADDVPMNAILEYDTAQIPADFYLQTHSTNPLLRSATVSRALQEFEARYPTNDSLFSVTRLQTRLYDASGKALNHNPAELLQTQALPPVFEENSCLYVFNREELVRKHHRIGDTPFMFEIGADEAWDIDEELDFRICDLLLREGSLR